MPVYIIPGNEKPSLENALQHFGVKGMRWGVRKESSSTRSPLTGLGPDRIERRTKNGDLFVLSKDPPNPIIKSLAAISPKYRDAYNRGASLTITDKDGKKIGDAIVDKRSDDELYLNWLGIKKHARGQGYATEAMKSAAEFGQKAGFKKMTLEVPGNSPDARHIYEKLGFKVTKEEIDPDDFVWGGLTSMEYEFKK